MTLRLLDKSMNNIKEILISSRKMNSIRNFEPYKSIYMQIGRSFSGQNTLIIDYII